MPLRLIIFLLTTYGYIILVVIHTNGLICRAQGTVGSLQRESLTFEWEWCKSCCWYFMDLCFEPLE